MDVLSVHTPESVDLRLELAGLGSRFVAIALDTVVQVLLAASLLFAGWATGWFVPTDLETAADSTWGQALLVLLFWLLFYFYFMVFELAWGGRTPGKWLVGIRVLDRSGRPASGVALVARNLVRIVDSLPVPVAYPAGVISFLFTQHGQRLGDLAGGTIVVRERQVRLGVVAARGRRRLDAEKSGVDPQIVALHVHRLTEAEAALVREFLDRRMGLRWEVRRVLAQRLAGFTARRMGYPYELRQAEPFLEAVGLARPARVSG